MQRFCEADAPVPKFLVADHLDLERVLDFFENRCRGSRDDEIVIIDDGGEDVGEFCGGTVEVAVHVDDELALIAKLLNCGCGVLLVFELFIDCWAWGFFGVRRICGRDGRDAQCANDDGKLYLDAPPENTDNCTTFFSHADAYQPNDGDARPEKN